MAAISNHVNIITQYINCCHKNLFLCQVVVLLISNNWHKQIIQL